MPEEALELYRVPDIGRIARLAVEAFSTSYVGKRNPVAQRFFRDAHDGAQQFTKFVNIDPRESLDDAAALADRYFIPAAIALAKLLPSDVEFGCLELPGGGVCAARHGNSNISLRVAVVAGFEAPHDPVGRIDVIVRIT
jgi:hypothetical protein